MKFAAIILTALLLSHKPSPAPKPNYVEPVGQESKHLKNLRQLTFGGQNAEAYWSFDGKKLIWQGNDGTYKADQIFTMNADGTDKRLVSTGTGRCTCSYFFPDGKHILFSSTHGASPEPPPPPDRSKGYVWEVSPTYVIYKANVDGTEIHPLSYEAGYNAESTIAKDGKHIVFTSTRNGDLDLYSMDANGNHVTQLTHELGYDGGAFYSRDGKHICYRAYHPKTEAEITEYKELLKNNLIRPSVLDLWVMNADGSNKKQVTNNHAANFCPFYSHDGKKIIFSSNLGDPQGREFDIYMVNVDGTHLERITYAPQFDGFPMFSPDGKHIAWASNRNGKAPHETNIFVADWVD